MFLLQKPLMQWRKGRTCHLEHVAIVAKPPPSANMVSRWKGTHSFTCVVTSIDCHTWNKNYIYIKYANWARIGLLQFIAHVKQIPYVVNLQPTFNFIIKLVFDLNPRVFSHGACCSVVSILAIANATNNSIISSFFMRN